MVEAEVCRQTFWQKLSPCLRAQLEELAEANTWEELAERWGFTDRGAVRKYVRGPLRRRLEREGADKWLRWYITIGE